MHFHLHNPCHHSETSLSVPEQKLLKLFVTHPGQTLPRGMLLESIWSDGMDYVDENALYRFPLKAVYTGRYLIMVFLSGGKYKAYYNRCNK